MPKPRKILIVKTGFSEFLDRGISTTVSLGDVLICTSILHIYKNDDVTWVTDWQARRLLQKNSYIKRLLIFGTSVMKELAQEKFDILVNLEKDIGICTLVNQIEAAVKYGFYFDDESHSIATRQKSTEYLLSGQENHGNIARNALELLYETVGETWNGQGLVLSPPEGQAIKYDIGFNHAVGSKWPTKAWPMASWKALEQQLKDKYSISWQQGHEDLGQYIEWINSCRMIVTSDSLGQAIGQALGKDVITLYGPTNFLRMDRIPHVKVVSSTLVCPHMPCYLPVCRFDKFCMDHISVDKVATLCREAIQCQTC
jgi:heptosyltransferase II